MSNQKIRIELRAYDSRLVEEASVSILGAAKRTGADVVGPIPLPVKRKVYTLIRSPHVFKKSREQFEIRTHKRLMYIYPTQQTVEALMKLELSAGVDVQIKLVEEGV
jgi:small subunit ribosomal protein S10